MNVLPSTTILDDLKFALRQMRRSPGFALTAVVILALGITANVTVFGVLQALILQPIHVPRPDRVKTFSPRPHGYPAYSWPEVRDVRDQNTVFSAVGAEVIDIFGLQSSAEATGTTQPVWGEEVSGQYFEAVGTRPALGRLLTRADDDHAGASQAAVLSWPAWKNLFGSDPHIVGRTVRLNKIPYTIVGVTEQGFNGTWKFLQPNIWVAMANQVALDGESYLEDRARKEVFPIARLKDGVTEAQAQAEMQTIAARVAKDHPKDDDKVAFWLDPPGLAGGFILGPASQFMTGLLVLAGIVLLAACANLGSLFAARTADRTREIAIRLAVGSSRWRVVRQVLVEAFVIAMLGGVGACGLSWLALTSLGQWHPPTDYPIEFLVQPQRSLLVVAFLISLVAGVLFGVMPLRQIFKADPNDAIKSGSSATTGRRWALRDVLLAAQIALCCVTVTAAFVSLRGLARTLTMDLGLNPKDAVLAKFGLSPTYSAAQAEQFQKMLQEKLSHLPGVEAVAYANTTPLGDSKDTPIYAEGTTDLRHSNRAFGAYYYEVSPGYFEAVESAIVEGRALLPSDTAQTPLVAVVSQKFASELFHTEHAVGRYFKNQDGKRVQIVGIVAEGKYFIPSEDPDEAVFFPILQRPETSVSFVVRVHPGTVSLADMTATVRRTIHDLDASIPIRACEPWEKLLAFSFFPAQVATVCLGVFGAFGLLLSITGTFGLASYTVSKRVRELSIRVALGAQGRQILSAALGRMLGLIGTGAVVGMLLGLATGKLLAHVVYQASAQDPVVLGAVALTIVLTGALSVAGPVRRALRIDPALLLREQ